jgi:hypothetical protein
MDKMLFGQVYLPVQSVAITQPRQALLSLSAASCSRRCCDVCGIVHPNSGKTKAKPQAVAVTIQPDTHLIHFCV